MYKKIAVLGGSFLQADFIKSAIDRGMEVYVLDGNKDCYISRWDNIIFKHLNFSDKELLKAFCTEHSIDFVYAPCNEVGNLVSSVLAPSLGYKYNPEEVVKITLDKSLQRKVAAQCPSLYSPGSIIYKENLEEIEQKLKYPMVIKPTSSSAGRGITGVNNNAELNASIETAKEFIKNGGEIIIEEYLEGDQISVETVSASGKHYIVGITLEIVGSAPLFIERCHFMNEEIHNRFYSRIYTAVQELLDQTGIMYGPCHIEMKVNEKYVALIEIASRAGGLRDRLMNMAGYPDYNELILDAYLDKNLDSAKLHNPTKHGLVNILTQVKDLDSVVLGKRDKCLHSLFLYEKGPEYNPQNIMDAYGYAYFTSTKDLLTYSLDLN